MTNMSRAEDKKSLKWFLINRFLVIMVCIFVGEELLGLLYNNALLPVMSRMLSNLHVAITAEGSLVLLLIHMLLYLFASFLPRGLEDYVQHSVMKKMEGSLMVAVDSPLFAGRWGILLRIMIITLILLLIFVTLLPYLVGAFCYYRIVTRKVNELIEAEKEQQLAYDRRRNLLLSDIAHDIKTPITTLCSYSKALSENMVQGEKQQEYLDAIYAKSLRMSELITLLFEYVKLDSSGFELHRQKGDLGDILREGVAALYADFEDRGIVLELEIPETKVEFNVDRVQMARAIGNLLSNAVRYGREGGRALVKLENNTITVADDGMEIDEAFAKHIFEPFSRADKARSTKGGSGLGLSIAFRIVEMHGGELKLDRAYGSGYTKAFQIVLPLR